MNRSSELMAALVLVTSGALFAQTPTQAVPKEFDHVRTLGHALAEFVDDRVQVVAAYYYSQSTHDIPWLLIVNRTGLVGGPIQREDGTHGTTQ